MAKNRQIGQSYKKAISLEKEDVAAWVDWMLNNPELAKKEYPELVEGIRENIKKRPSYLFASLIEKIPSLFSVWKKEIDDCLETTKAKKINQYIELLENTLYKYNFSDDFTKQALNNVRDELIEMEKYFKSLLNKPKKQKKKTSYVWQNNPVKELPELHSLMIDKYKLIAPKTTLEQFKAIFTGQPIDEIEPISWHQENASELVYFIDRLEQTDNIVHNPKKTDYQKMTACFVKPDGKQFKANWKQIKQNISINLSSDKRKAIDDLVSNF